MKTKDFSQSEQKIIRQIKRDMNIKLNGPYMFWFIYDGSEAISWEGGYGLFGDPKFRNQYTINKDMSIVKNW